MPLFVDVPTVVGHRGAPLLAPENTVASFVAAAQAGAAWVELDVRRTSDAGLVVHHDPVLADGRPIVDLPVAACAALGLPTLGEVLEALPPWLGVDVELKNLPGEPDFDDRHGIVAGLVEHAAALTARPAFVSSLNPLVLREAARALPELPRGLLFAGGMRLAAAAEDAAELGATVLCASVLTPDLEDAGAYATVHAGGCQVMVWTLDDPERACRMVDAGCDAVCTNDTAGLVAALSGC